MAGKSVEPAALQLEPVVALTSGYKARSSGSRFGSQSPLPRASAVVQLAPNPLRSKGFGRPETAAVFE